MARDGSGKENITQGVENPKWHMEFMKWEAIDYFMWVVYSIEKKLKIKLFYTLVDVVGKGIGRIKYDSQILGLYNWRIVNGTNKEKEDRIVGHFCFDTAYCNW